MPKNLIVVVFDTLRHDAVSGDLARTPNLDRFAAQSAVFDNAYGEGLPTIPFRRALFTGRRSFPWRHQAPNRGDFPLVRGWHAIPESHTTVAEYLYAHGYVTQLVSDLWHMFKPTMNFTRGFLSWDSVRGQEGDTYKVSAASFGDPRDIDRTRAGPASYLNQVQSRAAEDDYFVSQVFDRAAGFVRDIGSAAPYCLWVESFSPHEFWDPPLRFADSYHSPTAINHIVPSALNGTDPDPADVDRTRALYQGYVTFCDERFGRFMDELERSGALADSVVAVLSDHGTELWDKGRFGKSEARMHAYNTHINLMIRSPDGAGAGTHVAEFVQNHDVAPTLLALLGIGHPPLDGQNVWPLVVDTPSPELLGTREHVITGWNTQASVRTAEWNLLVDTVNPSNDLRLYQVTSDPAETINLAGERPEVVRELVTKLEALLGAPLPATYQHDPGRGPFATPGGLRLARSQQLGTGETWAGSNLE